jgi:hypothetical protein
MPLCSRTFAALFAPPGHWEGQVSREEWLYSLWNPLCPRLQFKGSEVPSGWKIKQTTSSGMDSTWTGRQDPDLSQLLLIKCSHKEQGL